MMLIFENLQISGPINLGMNSLVVGRVEYREMQMKCLMR